MVRRTFTGLVQMLGGLGAGLAIIALLAAWHLHKGPVSLAFLTPYVENALNAGHRNFKLAFDDTTLTWAGWERAIDLRVKNVRAIGEDGRAIARIPELSMSLSGYALMRGQLAPRYIELLGPELRIARDEDGSFGVEIAGNTEGGVGIAAGLIGWLLKRPAAETPMSYLETVRISGATMTYEDRRSDKVWEVPVGYLRLDRAPHGLLADGVILIDADGRVADIALSGSFRTEGQYLDITATFDDIEPASFAAIDEKLNPLQAVVAPLSGSLVVGMSLQDGIETVGFRVTGATGQLRPPTAFGGPFDIDSVSVRGIYNGRKQELIIDDAEATFAEGSLLRVPAPISHEFLVKQASGRGRIDLANGQVDFKKLTVDLGGPVFEMTGTVSGNNADRTAVLAETKIKNVSVNDVKDVWPQSLGSDAYAWVTNHMKDGIVHEASASIDVGFGKNGALILNDIGGSMIVDGTTVTYLDGMPPVTGAAGAISFDATTFDIAVERGKSGNLNVAGGTVHISGLDEVDQYADIDIRIEAPLGDVLRLIDHEPLGFATVMGIDPASTDGSGEIDLRLRFLLAKDLTLDQVEVEANAALTGVAMNDVVLGRGIRDGTLRLRADKKGMEVIGDVRMGRVPVDLRWDEAFDEKAPFRSRYLLSAGIEDLAEVRDLGLDPGQTLPRYVAGGIDAVVRYTVFDERKARVEVSADLSRAELRIPALEWRKMEGASGSATVSILLENGLVKRVPEFHIDAGTLSVRGDVEYSPGGLGLERVNLKKVLFDRSEASGAVISRADGSWEIGLHGSSLDISPLWDRIVHDRPGEDEMVLPDLTIALEFDNVWIDEERFLSGVSGTFVHRDDIWRTVLLDSRMNGNSLLNVSVTPDDTGNRQLAVRADDAGEALRFFDLFENMHGGKLEIRGRYDDAAVGQPLRGRLRVVNYRVRNAPLLTRILSIMALTGILDAMTGDGLNFAELDVPFTFRTGEMQISDAKAAGNSIGFTASGTVYTHADVLNLEGTVVPAYAINSLFKRIPLLGNLLGGNEEGGGVFAANFAVTGPIEDPKTTVNPLSALAPGILRNLFGALTPGEGGVPLGDPELRLDP